MTASAMLPAMDINHPNPDHESQYYLAKTRFPTDESNDSFELFICPYDPYHKITSKNWRNHLMRCAKNYGGKFKACTYNASHKIPEPEYDWHIRICNDRFLIAKDVNKCNESKMATAVDHHADRHVPSKDNWDNEIDESQPSFDLNPNKAMPMCLLPTNQEDVLYEKPYIQETFEYSGSENGDISKSVLTEQLLPEKPAGWNDWSKSQKKNYKRKYERQRQRMMNENLTEKDFARVTDPTKWTEKEREDKLNAIKAAYPLASEKMLAERVDYTSLLQIVCQKVKWNLPEYKECTSSLGGFGYQCRVGLKWYESKEFNSTKKDAKRNAAKWALLELYYFIPLDGSKSGCGVRTLSKADVDTLREHDEAGRLMQAGAYPIIKNFISTSQTPVLKQEPQIQQKLVSSQPHQEEKNLPKLQQFKEENIRPQQKAWSGWNSPAQSSQHNSVQSQSASNLNQSMNLLKLNQDVSVKDKELPSLDGGEDSWKTVQKKPVGCLSVGRGKLHGCGRGTTLKLS
ncbi:uncharacterized protein LOC100213388 isoform X1 [Hydra vulgaris]|uniref:uncharacterized protein LOC100213388 isoform X1 n=1 Tax=Hydra vulgaris TaxID=6087 RepID=UPI001F5EEE79|nr:uncharacterized protein LOC100213388 isoform X1 [Hydra vulgaris]